MFSICLFQTFQSSFRTVLFLNEKDNNKENGMFLLRDSLPGGGPLQKQTLLCRSAVLLTGAFSLTEIRQNFCKIKNR
ncbi:hypothetical protein CLOM621_08965 [Clostridium sp. M62/1]|nr:hypothetical protein CLOM621_08965 [Clostridium sp. M62/1]